MLLPAWLSMFTGAAFAPPANAMACTDGLLCEVGAMLKQAAEAGTCSDEDLFSIYASDSDLEAQTELFKAGDQLLRDEQIEVDPTLVGANWAIKMPSSSIYRVRGSLGGEILNTDAPSEEPTKEPTEEPAEESTQAPQPKPMTYRGSGDEVINFKKALTEPMLITTTWRAQATTTPSTPTTPTATRVTRW